MQNLQEAKSIKRYRKDQYEIDDYNIGKIYYNCLENKKLIYDSETYPIKNFCSQIWIEIPITWTMSGIHYALTNVLQRRPSSFNFYSPFEDKNIDMKCLTKGLRHLHVYYFSRKRERYGRKIIAEIGLVR